jgi:hypothetical protein
LNVYFDGRFDKTAVAGVVDEMEQDALRVESNSAHFVVVRGVNTTSEKVTNSVSMAKRRQRIRE